MPVVCWAPLAKSANDPTTIAEYIQGKIAVHNVDPSAHGLNGYAIYDHRVAPVLDHPNYVVTSDKISAYQIIGKHFVTAANVGPYVDGIEFDKNAISMWYQASRRVYIPRTGSPFFSGNLSVGYINYLKTVVYSNFESWAGWWQDLSGGALMGTICDAQLECAGTTPLFVAVNGADYGRFSHNRNPLFQIAIAVETNTNYFFYIGIGDYLYNSNKYCMFKLSGNTLYAVACNNGSESSVNLGAMTINQFFQFKIIVTSGVKAEYYINNALVATITTNLPTGTNNNCASIFFNSIDAVNRVLHVSSLLYVEDLA